MKTIDLIYVNAGGGHRSSALALREVIEQQQRPWQVRMVDLFEVLAPANRFGRATGMRPEAFYNKRLALGWTAGMTQELKLLQAAIRLGHRPITRRLERHWQATGPDLVVSLMPNFNRALHESLAIARPGAPFVTVLTDLADHPPRFWIERGQVQHLVCGTAKAVEQALALGHAPARVHRTSGMILRPEFHRPRPTAGERRAGRETLGLDPDRPTVLVLFGGHGSKAMLTIARQLPDIQSIFICGHNEALARRLRAMPANAPRFVAGFTQEIPRYMDLADFFIGKPGPGSISEAVQRGLPVIVVANARTMPQERFNAQWVRENRAGIVHDSFMTIRGAVTEMAGRIDAFRAEVARIENRAVYEITELLAEILAQPSGWKCSASHTASSDTASTLCRARAGISR